jgi:hypothetical protein
MKEPAEGMSERISRKLFVWTPTHGTGDFLKRAERNDCLVNRERIPVRYLILGEFGGIIIPVLGLSNKLYVCLVKG